MSQSWARAALLILKRLQHTKVCLAEELTATLNPVRSCRKVLQSGSLKFKAMVRSSACMSGSALQRREGLYLV